MAHGMNTGAETGRRLAQRDKMKDAADFMGLVYEQEPSEERYPAG